MGAAFPQTAVLLALVALLQAAGPPALSAVPGGPDVFVAYPDPGARVAFDHVILEGSVTPGAALSVSGRRVAVGPDGLFIEWWPLKPGVNDLALVATNGGRSGRGSLRVTRVLPPAVPARPTAIDRSSLRPAGHLGYWDAAGDSPEERRIALAFRGSPGGQAAYRIAGGSPVAMRETSPGVYSADYVLPPDTRFQDAAVAFTLTGRDRRVARATAPGRLSSTAAGPRLGIQKRGTIPGRALNDAQNLSTDLAGAPLLYPRDGMAFSLVGRHGDDLRARLGPGRPALIAAEQLETTSGQLGAAAGGEVTVQRPGSGPLEIVPVEAAPRPVPDIAANPASPDAVAPELEAPEPEAPDSGTSDGAPVSPPSVPVPWGADRPAQPGGAPAAPAPPASPAGDLQIRLPLGGVRLPFTIEQLGDGERLLVTLYGRFAAPLSAPPAPQDGRLRRLEVEATAGGVTRLRLELAPGQAWGFEANYDRDDLLVTVRGAPEIDPTRPLLNRVITLDPGHGGSQKGGAGSLRVPEKDLVLPIALRAADLLRAQGATVHLTRRADVTLGLYERGRLAERTGSELLVSIHANALPDGRDPRGIRGPEVYYTHPQARAPAAAILARLRRTLPDLGSGAGLRPGAFLALTRPSAQPSLLVETAYLTDAGNLRVLNSVQGRERLAQAIAAGIGDFFAAQRTAGPR